MNRGYRVLRTWNVLALRKNLHGGQYRDGVVFTAHGLVYVYAELGGDMIPGPRTIYHAVVAGRAHKLTEQRERTPRGLTIIAARWTRELHQDARKAEHRARLAQSRPDAPVALPRAAKRRKR